MPDEYSSAPINKLPPELLSNIFIILAAFSYQPDDRTTNHLTLLSSVCIRWRQALIATPTLWTSIDFVRGGQSAKELQYIDLCLERSQNALLHLRVGKRNFECNLDGVNETLSPILLSGAPRLESLAITYWRPGIAKQILAFLIAHEADKTLRSLALCPVSGDRLLYADPTLLPQDSLDSLLAPLQYLYLDTLALDWNLAPGACRNLVELQLIEIPMHGYPTAARFVQLLAANRGLRSIKLSRFELREYPSPDAGSVLDLPDLQNLEIFVAPNFMTWFFSLPIRSTRNLDLHLTSYQAESHITERAAALNSFFRRNHVRSLYLSGYWIPLSLVYTTLQSLETLVLRGHVLTKETFNGMGDVSRFLPILHTVDLAECIGMLEDIGPGLKSLLSIPSMRFIGVANSSFYHHSPGGQRLMDAESTRKWLEEGGVTAAITCSSMSRFYVFDNPFR